MYSKSKYINEAGKIPVGTNALAAQKSLWKNMIMEENGKIEMDSVNDELNELVDKLEKDRKDGGLKLMNDGMFDIDIRPDIDAAFDIGEPVKKEEDGEVIYI